MRKTKKYTAINGVKVAVNITAEACAPFGFKPGERIVTTEGKYGTVIGAAVIPTDESKKINLWTAFDEDGSKISVVKDPKKEIFSLAQYEARKKDLGDKGKKMTCVVGHPMIVDVSDEACLPFGFKAGVVVLCKDGTRLTVAGVAPENFGIDGENKLWFANTEGKEGIIGTIDENPLEDLIAEETFLAVQRELEAKGGVRVVSREGKVFVVDVSDEACLPFGFKANEMIITPKGVPSKIMGVAPIENGIMGEKVLWLINEGDFRASHCGTGNIREKGAITKQEFTDRQTELLKNGGQEITPRAGEKFVVDVSDEACLPFGFKAGTKVFDGEGKLNTVLGVAPENNGTNGKNVLWTKTDDEEGAMFIKLEKMDGWISEEAYLNRQTELLKNGGLEIIIPKGIKVVVDTSDEACLPFGFKAGTRILDPMGRFSTIAGVAPERDGRTGKNAIWVTLDEKQRVGCYDPQDLRAAGFITEQEAITAKENLLKNGGQEFKSCNNDSAVILNTSAEALKEFDLKPGEKIKGKTVVGVGLEHGGLAGEKTIWITCDKAEGKVCPVNKKSEGMEKIAELFGELALLEMMLGSME